MGALHSKQTISEGIHTAVAYTYADTTALNAATGFTAADVGKIACKLDEFRYYVLADESPITWVEISNEGANYFLWTDVSFSTTQNNLTPANWSNAQYQNIRANNTNASTIAITGLANGVDGRIARIFATGTGAVQITNESASSTAANRFTTSSGNLIIPVGSCVSFVYSSVASRWVQINGNAAHLNFGTTSNTVAAGDDSRFVRNVETTYDVWYEADMHRITTLEIAPFNIAVISTGVLNNASYPLTDTISSGLNVPITIRSSTTANSGARFYTENLSMVLAGGSNQKSYVFNCRVHFAGISTRNLIAGFNDSTTNAEPVDGIYFLFNGTNIVGKHSSNSVRSTTASSFVPSADLDYDLRIETDGSTNTTTFRILSYGVQVWTDTVSTNAPSLVARACGVAVIATCSAAAATNICALSYIGFGTRQAWLAKTVG